MGKSARFRREPLAADEKQHALYYDINGWVTKELAEPHVEEAVERRQNDREVIKRGRITPQYRVHTLKSDATLWHVTGVFGDGNDDFDVPEVGDTAYTTGYIWTSTDPRWVWRVSGAHYTCCRIDVPAGKQVIVDRAPTMPRPCKHDNDKISYFPDVLISAGKFTVVAVSKFRPGGGDGYEKLSPEAARRAGLEGCGRAAVYVDLHLCLEDNIPLPQTGGLAGVDT